MVIDIKTEFKCKAYNIVRQTIRALYRVNNKTVITVTSVCILVKQGYIDKVKLFCETY